jgi:hypothetical protein
MGSNPPTREQKNSTDKGKRLTENNTFTILRSPFSFLSFSLEIPVQIPKYYLSSEASTSQDTSWDNAS